MIPEEALKAVFVSSEDKELPLPKVNGYDFNKGNDVGDMLRNYFATTGFQATAMAKAIQIIDEMITWRLSDEEVAEDEVEQFKDPEVRRNTKCKIFFGYTSNMVSSGVRDIIRYLVQHKMVDVLVTTAGGIEEDFIKCLAPSYVLGKFRVNGEELRKKGLNRIGNLLVPNSNYVDFENWVMPILDQLLLEQKESGIIWSPSQIINRLGKEINNEESIYYWCYKNNIPVYCPALTDGSLGDMIYFHSFKNPGLIIDLVQDIRDLNNQAVFEKKTGMIVLGGGVVKHHVCNANLMRNGADLAVYINTGQEFDGSDSGAHPEEAISWGKIRMNAKHVKICADASIIFPLIVSQTFANREQ
ncbi:hypothetical protein MP638_003079 [Amoeboaphelidium occidentale]|nr:hypothetical protein MP638_003079 [Amoeboaphelidium occidentale]